ncbi:MAG: hypothetical protein ACN4GR_04100 [Arenicellales bacterium]
MKIKIEARIKELQQELESGRNALAELESRTAEVRSQMLRINGAIQVLEELLSESESSEVADPPLKSVNQ